jgi:hypothetical protein
VKASSHSLDSESARSVTPYTHSETRDAWETPWILKALTSHIKLANLSPRPDMNVKSVHGKIHFASSSKINEPNTVIALTEQIEALCYKPQSWAFDSRCHWTFSVVPMSLNFFSSSNPSSRTKALRSTQSLLEISTRNLPGGKGWAVWCVRLTSPPSVNCLGNVWASTSHNCMDLHDLLQE